MGRIEKDILKIIANNVNLFTNDVPVNYVYKKIKAIERKLFDGEIQTGKD